MGGTGTARRWLLAGLMVAVVAALAVQGYRRLTLQTDLLAVLPGGDPVISDARYVLSRHPAMDRVAVEVAANGAEVGVEELALAGDALASRLIGSGLFTTVGQGAETLAFPTLMGQVSDHLPVLFSAAQLEREVLPLLRPERVRGAVEEVVRSLSGLDGVGQAELMLADPLGLRNRVLARLAALLPGKEARLHRGHLLSTDGRRLLLLAEPSGRATDIAVARSIDAVVNEAKGALENDVPGLTVTPVGAYRAALDNEEYARSDTNRAVWLASAGIALLLLLCFPRPLFGLLALIPAVSGTLLGLFFYSLLRPSISVLALGFGGAIVSITVDHGIAYFLFLDRDRAASGAQASHEVRSVGLLTVLTTVGAFLSLLLSGFPVLEQLGLFAALGVGCSFLFVHFAFPIWFPQVAAARRRPLVEIEGLTARLALGGGRAAAMAALLAGVFFGLNARPEFRTDLNDMNTVKPETLAAEKLVKENWGDVLNRTWVLIEGEDLEALRREADRLALFIEEEARAGVLDEGFSPSLLLPGVDASERNFAAWKGFWTSERTKEVASALSAAAVEGGLDPSGFDAFVEQIERAMPEPPEMTQATARLTGVLLGRGSGSAEVALCPVVPKPGFDAAAFHGRVARAGFRMLDPSLFSTRLAGMLVDTFTRLLLMCGAAVLLLLLFFFFDYVLVLLVLVPIGFALACTLGALHLMDRPLDVPGLLLAVVVLGMGVDYSLLFVRAHQRYLDERHPSLGPVRSAVFLAAATTMLGFGAMAVSQHGLLRSGGLIGLLGIAASLVGAFAILPPVLRGVFADPGWPETSLEAGSREHRRAILLRYVRLEPYPRQFARFKLALDPMFSRLKDFVPPDGAVLDIGCGYGVPGAYLMTLFPRLRFFGVEPDPERARVARRVFGSRGRVVEERAPGLSGLPDKVDTALLLDMAHYLHTDELTRMLADLRGRLNDGGTLVMRVTVPTRKRFPWERMLERLRVRALGWAAYFRSPAQVTDLLRQCGFAVELVEPTRPGREETWFVARVGTLPPGPRVG
ncbi:MAG: methyltransferase domain-containing protein [Deltaproteobacteria bacterium]|nr:methyltransferase domain-containing protein [Deltaproteobacteria bacterium]